MQCDKCKEAIRENEKMELYGQTLIRFGIRDNPLLSIIGIRESEPPYDPAENHNRHIYGDMGGVLCPSP